MMRLNSNIPWTPAHDQQLLDLVAAEATWPLIAATLGRSARAVKERAQKLGVASSKAKAK
jgi:hypothetical protein